MLEKTCLSYQGGNPGKNDRRVFPCCTDFFGSVCFMEFLCSPFGNNEIY